MVGSQKQRLHAGETCHGRKRQERRQRSCFFSWNKYFFNVCLFLWQILVAACRIFDLRCNIWDLIPRPRIELGPPALRAWSLSHWTTREVGKLFPSWKSDAFSFYREWSGRGTTGRKPWGKTWSLGLFLIAQRTKFTRWGRQRGHCGFARGQRERGPSNQQGNQRFTVGFSLAV